MPKIAISWRLTEPPKTASTAILQTQFRTKIHTPAFDWQPPWSTGNLVPVSTLRQVDWWGIKGGFPFKIMKGIWEEKEVDSTAMIDVPAAFSNMTTIEGGTGINSNGKDRREKRIGFWGAFLTTLFCREPTTERSGKQHTPHYQSFPCHEEIEHTGTVYNTINPSSTASQ